MSPADIVQRHQTRGPIPRVPHSPESTASFATRAEALMVTVALIVVTLGVGWLGWSVAEWRHGRTASYRLTKLRVVRRSNGQPISLWRSIVRNGVCCTLLIVPTLLVCVFLAVVFVMGASPPADLMSKSRLAPWDRLTGTVVLDERTGSGRDKTLRLGRLPADVGVSMN